MRDLKTFIEKYAALLPVGNSISFTDAERRASEFLTAQATITDFRHLLTTERIKCLTVQTAVFAQQMSKGAGKTVTQDKLNAEASDEYIHAREDLENIENDLAYLRAYYDIFNNAHIFYRNMAKGENV